MQQQAAAGVAALGLKKTEQETEVGPRNYTHRRKHLCKQLQADMLQFTGWKLYSLRDRVNLQPKIPSIISLVERLKMKSYQL